MTVTANVAVKAAASVPLTEDGRFITVKRKGVREDVWVGELSLDQITALFHFCRRAFRAVDRNALLELARKADRQSAEENYAQAQMVIDLAGDILTREEVGELVGIMIDRDGAWAREYVTGPTLAAIIATLLEFNDPRVMLDVFRKAWRAAPRQSVTSSPSSSP